MYCVSKASLSNALPARRLPTHRSASMCAHHLQETSRTRVQDRVGKEDKGNKYGDKGTHQDLLLAEAKVIFIPFEELGQYDLVDTLTGSRCCCCLLHSNLPNAGVCVYMYQNIKRKLSILSTNATSCTRHVQAQHSRICVMYRMPNYHIHLSLLI